MTPAVLRHVGEPTVAQFAGAPGPAIVIDTETGTQYWLAAGDVVTAVADSAVALNIDPLAAYYLNDLEDASPVYNLNDLEDASPMYIGKAKGSGAWLVQRYTAAGEMRYANLSNNPGTATYASAWAARASLVYSQIQTLTGI